MRQMLEDAILAEQQRRRRLKARGRPLHYWRERGDDAPPRDEYWCDHCVGFYGVPHSEFTHQPGVLCRNMRRERVCACIDCVVYERWADSQETT